MYNANDDNNSLYDFWAVSLNFDSNMITLHIHSNWTGAFPGDVMQLESQTMTFPRQKCVMGFMFACVSAPATSILNSASHWTM